MILNLIKTTQERWLDVADTAAEVTVLIRCNVRQSAQHGAKWCDGVVLDICAHDSNKLTALPLPEATDSV